MSADLTAIAARIPLEAFAAGKVDVLDEILADDYVVHVLPAEGVGGVDVLCGLIGRLRSAFPDLSYSVDDAIVSGLTVAMRATACGTQTGQLQSLPPTGKRAQWTEMHFLRFDGERVVEHWGVADEFAALQQLGIKAHAMPAVLDILAGREIRIPDSAKALVDGYEAYGS
ncbi:MAG TPA: ester cyclase [Mycobacteriales bacterium]|nr:ester cyclase [Mycobacteriales bacterium]